MAANLTISVWGDSVGISRQAAYQAVKRCEIPVSDGMVDADVATMLYRKRTRTRANERAPEAPPATPERGAVEEAGGDYWASRARREKAEADLAELKLAEQRGDLVRAADVRAHHAKRLAALREGLLQLPARLSPILAAESDPARCHDALQRELHGVLQQVAG